MKVLVISTLYPNASQPVHALFVEQRVATLSRRVPVRVLAPVPWFPLAGWMRRYRHRRLIPHREVRRGVEVRYPRFLSIPRLAKPLDGLFLFVTCLVSAAAIRRSFAFDRIDAHLAFPDGWAAVLLGRVFRVPVAVTLRGHDVNDLPRFPVRRRQVSWTLRRAGAVFAVADALREAALGLGAPPERVVTVGNGVDADRFAPMDRAAARSAIGLDGAGPLLLSVGHLVERKGFHHLIRALPVVLRRFPSARLAIVGAPGEEGDFSSGIRSAIREAGVEERVILPGAVAHTELACWYSAADVFCLASAKEGRANVLLEALASGTPVVATRVWGTPEIVSAERYGILVDSTEPAVLGDALGDALGRPWDREALAAHGRSFSWEATAREVERVLSGIGSEQE
ncbi:MAG: glycosyltransferase [Candidatus Eiseniibacteriota bacterium]